MTPENAAGSRALLAAARAAGWKHDVTPSFAGTEHRWRSADRECAVGVRGNLLWWSLPERDGSMYVTSAQQVADLLHAVGLVPVELTSGWKAAAEEISERCLAQRDRLIARYQAYPNALDRAEASGLETAAHIARTATREESPA